MPTDLSLSRGMSCCLQGECLLATDALGLQLGGLQVQGLDGEWLIPCRSEVGTVRDVRRYDGKRVMSTAGCKSQLWGADRLAASQEGALVLLCEGEWDGMAARWMLRDSGRDDVVVAVPGATTFKPEWASLLRGKRVVTVYDHDDAGDRG